MITGPIRINKAIAQSGVASRREADRLISQGLVRVNGEPVLRPGLEIESGRDRLEVNGREVAFSRPPAREVWALYKPKNCVTTLDDPQGRTTIKEFFPRGSPRLFPVGRLDYDAEGLILITNDGTLAQRVAHPSFSVRRVYLVKVKGLVDKEALERLVRKPTLDGVGRRPARARILHHHNDKTWLEVALWEGIHHHIKKLFASLEHRVLKIKRYQIGPVELADLEPGKSRRLSKAEVSALLGDHPKPGLPE